ncbi:histidine phosphotransferase ChpT [Bartonella harrusi]|uniref:Histidine phosphotransferase family protein n=1 Tax=Bartonella harrusi TaxID=2961895 RepID=A0ABY5EU17_9HYPH|nr:histidine phosphotransferase family protein [Bartonella harrusi]UTO27973.1 histidine phosphotransferase family protein [Bartonella harrusi]
MTLAVSLKPADLAALLCSRICHDLVSPVGAIQNAMELYDEGGAEEDALQLVRWSVASACARLQFARLAFGFSGANGEKIETRSAEQVAQQYMKEEKAILNWQAPSWLLPKNEVKLLLNLLLIANATASRGGEIIVMILQDEKKRSFRFKISGKSLRIPPHFMAFYKRETQEKDIDAHAIQFYYTVLLAEMTDMQINIDETENCIILDTVKSFE